jgi:hypothetical protein
LNKSLVSTVCVGALFFGALCIAMGFWSFTEQPKPNQPSRVLLGAICTTVGVAIFVGCGVVVFLTERKLSRTEAITAATVGNQPLLFGRGLFTQGLTAGRGIVVCRPGYVAFLPTEPIRNMLGEMVTTVALHAVGVVKVGLSEEIPVDEWVDSLRRDFPDQFDQKLLDMVDQAGGITWRADQMTVTYDADSPARRKRMSFRSGKATIYFSRRLSPAAHDLGNQLFVSWTRPS